MSHLVISSSTQEISMNVLAFASPLYASISSAQTRTKAVHFPIRVTQPDIEFTVIFSSEKKFEEFGRFVRVHQHNSLGVPSLLTLNWPQRNIVNWTGFIEKFQAGGARRNYTPRATFQVTLITSMVSSRTEIASLASPWQAIYGGIGLGPDAVLSPPTAAQQQDLQENFGPFPLSGTDNGIWQ